MVGALSCAPNRCRFGPQSEYTHLGCTFGPQWGGVRTGGKAINIPSGEDYNKTKQKTLPFSNHAPLALTLISFFQVKGLLLGEVFIAFASISGIRIGPIIKCWKLFLKNKLQIGLHLFVELILHSNYLINLFLNID